MKLSKKADSTIEWAGALLVLGAFFSVTSGLQQPRSLGYLAANIIGSVGIAYGAYKKKDLPPVALNIAWILIAIVGLANA